MLELGTILAGIATQAEAAAAGAFGALVLSYFYKTLRWENFKQSVFLTAKTTAWVDTELTRTFEDSATGSISTDNQPLKQTYLAFRGFGEIFDDGGLSLTDKMSNVNPPLSYDLLQSNIEVFHNADDELYIPFLSTSGSGVFSVSLEPSFSFGIASAAP